MVLAQWLERGLGQIFAPDPSYKSQADIIDSQSSLWQTLAPDPNFSPEKKASSSSASVAATPPPHAFRTPPKSRGGGGSGSERPMWTSPGGKITRPKDLPPQLQEEMLQASIDTAAMATRNGKYQKDAKKLLGCASQKRLVNAATKEELIQLLQNDLKQHKEHVKLLLEEGGTGEGQPPLYDARTLNAGMACPDGYTPLQAAARSGVIEVAQMLLQLNEMDDVDNNDNAVLRRQLQRTNLYGQTAKHLAAQNHHEDIVDLIQQYEQSLLNQPLDEHNNDNNRYNPFASPAIAQQQRNNFQDSIDVTGKTPFDTLLTSPAPKGKNKNMNSLRNKLLSPNNMNLFGSPAPAHSMLLLRSVAYPDIHTVHATAHLNGMRINNEDALFATTWQYMDKNTRERCPVGFFIVCDGKYYT
jgi:Ankyrin repeats (3 copies)